MYFKLFSLKFNHYIFHFLFCKNIFLVKKIKLGLKLINKVHLTWLKQRF
jgi:hypothetical protein